MSTMKFLKYSLICVFVTFLIIIILAYPFTQINENVLEVFFAVFGIIYAIIGGFIIMILLENHMKIKNHIWADINAIQDLRDFLIYVDNQADRVKEIKDTISCYVKSIIEIEWLKMSNNKPLNNDTSEEIYDIMKAVNKIEVANKSDAVALDKLISTIGVITTYRTNRIASSQHKLPALLQFFINVLSILVIIIFSQLDIDVFFVKLLLNGIIIFSVILIYIIIWDLSNPFKGTWRISSKPYEALLNKFLITSI